MSTNWLFQAAWRRNLPGAAAVSVLELCEALQLLKSFGRQNLVSIAPLESPLKPLQFYQPLWSGTCQVETR